jgi:hypothetical protein
MVPLQLLYCPLAVIGITAIYIGWQRWWYTRVRRPADTLRERVAYMLWVAATKG